MTPNHPQRRFARAALSTALSVALSGALAGAMLGLSPDATAAVVVQQHNFDLFGSSAPFHGPGTVTVADQTQLSYARWDPAQGTLTGARWVLSSWLDASAIGHLHSTSTNPDEQVEGQVELGLVAGAMALVGSGNPAWSMALDHQFGFGCVTSAALGECALHLDFSEPVAGEFQATVLADFLGAGNFTQSVSAQMALSNTVLSAAADISSLGAFGYDGAAGTPFGGWLALVYEYELPAVSVPEPSSALLAGLALCMAALRRPFFGRGGRSA